ncbi:uncharacterized protein QYS62_000640 [Fusarium acuminatum]|uniref:BTB domain-containing protein n=1 Tax=Fusarium acuminatum TaxID=5515 RepID=A0ABZ2WH43_9HYPO
MNLELLERFRGSYPSRQSFMGFINHGELEPTTSKPSTPEPEVLRHTTADTDVFDTPTSAVEKTPTCEILDSTTNETPNATAYEVLDTPNDEAENTSTYKVENTPTYDVENIPTRDIENTPTCEVGNTLTCEIQDTTTSEIQDVTPCEDLATTICFGHPYPTYENVNSEHSLEISEQITDENHITQQDDAALPNPTYTTYLTYPNYYETSIYDSISSERLPPIMEDTVYEPRPVYHKTSKHLSIEPFIATQQENPEVSLDNAPGTSDMINSEPEITECTTPDSLDFELESAPQPKANEPIAIGFRKSTICFDPNGDLMLTIGSGLGRNMLVDSRALSRASHKLHTILSRDGKRNDNSWTLELPEDDPLPFTILLDLIHTRFERIPVRVTLNQLYGICILTQKYNITEVLRPVAERWYKYIGWTPEGEYGLFFKKAFVAWELGFTEDLSEMAGHVVLNCYLDEDDQLVIGKEKEKLSDFSDFQRIPLLKCIEEHRELAMETCWEECQKLSDQVLKGSIKGSMCHASHSREEVCLMLGKMLSKAGEENILDFFMTGSIYQYCPSLRLDLATLDHKIVLVADYIDMCGWCEGVFDTMNEIRCQLLRAADPLYMSHIQALEVQASKIRMRPWVTDYDQEE